MEEKILIWSQIFEMRILMYLHIMRSLQSRDHNFCRTSLYPKNSKTDYSRNFVSHICTVYNSSYNLNYLMKIGQQLYARARKKIEDIPANEWIFLLAHLYLDFTKSNEVNIEV